eukprot:gene12091-13220_t
MRALPALFSVSGQTQGIVEIPFLFERLTIELQELGNSGGGFFGGGNKMRPGYQLRYSEGEIFAQNAGPPLLHQGVSFIELDVVITI